MADSNIKKVIIKRSELPPIRFEDEGYVFRYRIISDDRNRRSHWSPIKIIKPQYTFISGDIHHDKSGEISTIAWTPVIIKKNNTTITTVTSYDLWIKWGRDSDGDWIYAGQIDNNSTSLIIPTTYTVNEVVQAQAPNRLSVEIYLKGSPVARSSSFLRVYQAGPYTV